MAAHEALGEQFGPKMGMLAEAVRRDTATQHGVAHDAPNAPVVTKVEPQDERRARYHPEASHHISVQYEEPGHTHTHVYGVHEDNEYMHNHTIAHVFHKEQHPMINVGPRTETTYRPG